MIRDRQGDESTADNGSPRWMTEPLLCGLSNEQIMQILGREPSPDFQPCGTVGVVSQELSRFTNFWLAFQGLVRPATTKFVFPQGMDVNANYNRLIDGFLGDWLWIMGDDHTFLPDTLMRLLAHEVDVVVPLCLKRHAPFDPVVYSGEGEVESETGLARHEVARLPRTGLVEVHAAGSAGMLIRRHVVESLTQPIFETTNGYQNEDLRFCQKVRDAGFKIWCDVDTKIGHIGTFIVQAQWQGDDETGMHIPIMDLGNGYPYPYVPGFFQYLTAIDALEREQDPVT